MDTQAGAEGKGRSSAEAVLRRCALAVFFLSSALRTLYSPTVPLLGTLPVDALEVVVAARPGLLSRPVGAELLIRVLCPVLFPSSLQGPVLFHVCPVAAAWSWCPSERSFVCSSVRSPCVCRPSAISPRFA